MVNVFLFQAIWFTDGRAGASDNPNDQGVFGAKDHWNGLGVFLDSFDNDGQVCGLLIVQRHLSRLLYLESHASCTFILLAEYRAMVVKCLFV